MKKEIHPEYHNIKVQMTTGETFQTRSTWGKADATLVLDIDPTTHPAWTKGQRRLIEAGQLARFRKRYSNFGLAGK